MADNEIIPPDTSFKSPRNILILVSIVVGGILITWLLSRGLTSVENLKEIQPTEDGSLTQMMQDQMKQMNARTELPDVNSINTGGE